MKKNFGLSVILLIGILVSNYLAECSQNYPGMLFFPEGDFWMGSSKNNGRSDEKPRHKVFLSSFYLDIYETTGKEFEEYLSVHPKEHPTVTGWYGRKVKPGLENRPVIALTWIRCVRYCRWRGKRLPTEAEWERAAGGIESRLYPWGNDSPNKNHTNFNKCCFIMKGNILDTIGAHPKGATPEGIYDLAGNIAEWVHDWYDKMYYKRSPRKNPTGPKNGKFHVIRGGAWNSMGGYLRSASRYGYNDANDFYGIGCRCAKS